MKSLHEEMFAEDIVASKSQNFGIFQGELKQTNKKKVKFSKYILCDISTRG